MGIGEATARLFAAEGAKLVLAARGEATLQALAGKIGALAVPCDVTRDSDCDRLVKAALEAYGRIDVLVNNAGVGSVCAVADLTPAELQKVMDVNVNGALRLVRRVVPIMRAQGGGQIVNVSSVLGERAIPLAGAYCASKFALNALTEALRVELAPDRIDVLLVAPGLTATGFKRNTLKAATSTVDRTDRESKAGASAISVAQAILRACRRHTRTVRLTAGGRAMIALNRYAPRLLDFVFARAFRDQIERARRPQT